MKRMSHFWEAKPVWESGYIQQLRPPGGTVHVASSPRKKASQIKAAKCVDDIRRSSITWEAPVRTG